MVAEHDSPYDAAIAAPLAAERYRLSVLAHGIGDNPDAVTRFVLVSRVASMMLPDEFRRRLCVNRRPAASL